MIVQELLAIQERCGYLPPEELRALARRIQKPLHSLHEVASFYPHFKLEPPKKVEVKVCRDMACHVRGSPRLTRELEALANELGSENVSVCGVSCLGQCDSAPSAVAINDHTYWGLPEDEIRKRIRDAAASEPLKHQHRERGSVGWKIDPYNGAPRYDIVKQYVQTRDSAAILKALETAYLRGMGGAGFPTFMKWTGVKNEKSDAKYVICNADECEPGTFKDRELLRRTPHLVIEGMVIAGLITGATQGTLYIRHEYHDELHAFNDALAQARADKICGNNILGSGLNFPIDVFISPGGYIQGEESALMEAMEDKRGEPRNKPPYPTVVGLHGKPTVINNVETLAWVPRIAMPGGGEWYRDSGINGATGMRFVSISGDVKKPGVYEVPFGQTVRDLVMNTAGGMSDGQKLKAIATSGPSGGFLPAFLPASTLPKIMQEKLSAGAAGLDTLDMSLDLSPFRGRPRTNELLIPADVGSMLGAAFVVYGDRADMVEQALNCVEFYRNESCGKCVPCRLGSQKLTDIIKDFLAGRGTRAQLPMVDELAQTMTISSICGLGMVAANPMAFVMKFFAQDLEKYLK